MQGARQHLIYVIGAISGLLFGYDTVRDLREEGALVCVGVL